METSTLVTFTGICSGVLGQYRNHYWEMCKQLDSPEQAPSSRIRDFEHLNSMQVMDEQRFTTD